MKSERASELYEAFKEMVVAGMGEGGAGRVKDGMFGAMMDVALVNDGPVTILVDSPSSDCAGGDSAREGVREEK
jgi:D-tyrosyl-tRNA(Tyr) deacylase